MTDQQQAWNMLDEAGAVGLVQWAAETAFARVHDDFDDDAGHDQTVAGTLAYTYLRDLTDRATASGRYALPESAEGETTGRDVLRRGISEDAFSRMPSISPGLISRNDYNGSPGWSVGGVRWILQSFPFGGVDKIQWNQKSESKQAVAAQRFIDTDNTLDFMADYGLDEVEGAQGSVPVETLVLAHSYNLTSGEYEVYIGRSKSHDLTSDSPWHWKRLIASGGSFGSVSADASDRAMPGAPATHDVSDIDVPLRKQAASSKKE